MNFGQALEALKKGEKICRKGWNGKGMFIFLMAGGDAVIPGSSDESTNKIRFNPYMVIKNVDDSISTWVPSVNDCLSEDWEIKE